MEQVIQVAHRLQVLAGNVVVLDQDMVSHRITAVSWMIRFTFQASLAFLGDKNHFVLTPQIHIIRYHLLEMFCSTDGLRPQLQFLVFTLAPLDLVLFPILVQQVL